MSSEYENPNVPEIDDTPSIRVHIAELVLIANARVLPARRVPLTAALTVADRVLARTPHTDASARAFAVERAVDRFITLATLGLRTNEKAEHFDLLPISHPLSAARSGLTASAIAEARAEWLSADPRIAEELRPLVASIQTMEFGSLERMHALARLEAAGRDIPLDLVALIADGNSSAARSARAKRQLRDRLKRFAFEGHMGSFLVRFGSKVKSQLGVLVGGSSTTNTGELYITEDDASLGLKKGDILPVNLDNFESLGVVLTTDQLKKAGIELPAGKASTVKRAQDIKDLLANKLEAPSDWKKLPNGDFATEDGFIATPKGDLKYELKDQNGNVVEGLDAAEWPAIQAHIKKVADDEFGSGTEQPAEAEAATYLKKDLRVDQLYTGDLLPDYYPIKGAEENMLKKRQADPSYELPPTEEILGIYKGKAPGKYGIKIRNLKTGKERYFEVNKTARIYDVRQKQLPKAEVKPAAESTSTAPSVPGSLDNLGIDFQSATMDASGTRLPTPGAFTGEFQNIMQGAQSWKDVQDRLQGQTVTYFDFETTGIADYDGQDITNDSVQLGAVKVKDGKIIGRFNVYTNPESKLSDWSAKNLGRDILDENGNRVLDENGKPKTTLVTPEWLAQQKSKDDAIKEFMAFIGPNALLGGQNVPFDVEILKRMADDAGVKLDIAGTIDSKDLASLLPKYDPETGTDGPKAPDRKTGEIKATTSLGPVANFLGFEPANWHSADGDAEDAYNLVSRIIDRAAKEDNKDLSLLDFPAMKKRYEERMAEFKNVVSPNNPTTDNQKKALEEFSNSANPEIAAKAKDALASAKTRGEAAGVLQQLHAADSKATPQEETLVDKTGPEIKVGDVVVFPDGSRRTVAKKFSMDTGDRITFEDKKTTVLDEPNTLKVVSTSNAAASETAKPAAAEPFRWPTQRNLEKRTFWNPKEKKFVASKKETGTDELLSTGPLQNAPSKAITRVREALQQRITQLKSMDQSNPDVQNELARASRAFPFWREEELHSANGIVGEITMDDIDAGIEALGKYTKPGEDQQLNAEKNSSALAKIQFIVGKEVTGKTYSDPNEDPLRVTKWTGINRERASKLQLHTIRTTVDKKDLPPEQREEILRSLDNGTTVGEASNIINMLYKLPFRKGSQITPGTDPLNKNSDPFLERVKMLVAPYDLEFQLRDAIDFGGATKQDVLDLFSSEGELKSNIGKMLSYLNPEQSSQLKKDILDAAEKFGEGKANGSQPLPATKSTVAPINRPSKKQTEMIRSMLRERVMTSEERQGYMDRLASIDKFGVNTLFNELKVLPKAKVALTDGSDPLNQHTNPELAKIKEKLAPFDLDGSIRRSIDEKTANGGEITSQEIRDLLKGNKNWEGTSSSYSDYSQEGTSLNSALNAHKTEGEAQSSADAKAKSEETAKALSDKLDALKQGQASITPLSKEEHQSALDNLVSLISDSNDPENTVRSGILDGTLRNGDDIIAALNKQQIKNEYKTMSPTGFATGYKYISADESQRPEEWAIINAAYGLPAAPEGFEPQFVTNALKGYDNENGDLSKLINSGAPSKEIFDWLRTKSPGHWNSREGEYNTSWAVDFPTALDKARWKKFGELKSSIAALDKNEASTEAQPDIEFLSAVSERLPDGTIAAIDEELGKAFNGDTLSELISKISNEEDLQRVIDEISATRTSKAVKPQRNAQLQRVQDALIKKFYENHPELENTMAEPANIVVPAEAPAAPAADWKIDGYGDVIATDPETGYTLKTWHHKQGSNNGGVGGKVDEVIARLLDENGKVIAQKFFGEGHKISDGKAAAEQLLADMKARKPGTPDKNYAAIITDGSDIKSGELVHWTTPENAKSIIENGFNPEGKDTLGGSQWGIPGAMFVAEYGYGMSEYMASEYWATHPDAKEIAKLKVEIPAFEYSRQLNIVYKNDKKELETKAGLAATRASGAFDYIQKKREEEKASGNSMAEPVEHLIAQWAAQSGKYSAVSFPNGETVIFNRNQKDVTPETEAEVIADEKSVVPEIAPVEPAPVEQATDTVKNPFSSDNSDKLLAETGGSRSLVTGADMSIAMILDKQDIGYEPMLKGVSGNENVIQNLLDSLDESDGANSIAVAGDLYSLHDALYKEGAPVALTEYIKKLADSVDSFTPAEGGNKNNVVTVDTIKEEQAGSLDLSKWKKVGGQKGSNPGGTFENPATGEQVYVKAPKSQLHGENERLASAIYDAAGISSAKVLAGKDADGIDVTYSPMIDGAKQDLKKNLNNKEYMARLQQGFAIDALLANWDVIGLDYDNVVTDKNGEPVRVDPGGALLFRAQGSPKGGAFGEEVPELDAFTDKTSTRPSAKVFSQMSDEQKLESAKVLQNLSTSQIDELVDSIITDPAKQEELKTKLKARRQYILDKFGLSDKPAKKKNPEAGSSGKTKKLDVNGDNDSLKTQLEDAAKNGDLVSFKYNDKERVVAPTYVWTNPKNGNINLTGEEDGVSKNYTLQNFKPSEVDVPEEAPSEGSASSTITGDALKKIVDNAYEKYDPGVAQHSWDSKGIGESIMSHLGEIADDIKSGKDLDTNESAKKLRQLAAMYNELVDAVTSTEGEDGAEWSTKDSSIQDLIEGAKELESQADSISPKGGTTAKVETPTTPVAAPESTLLNLADEKVRTDTAQSIQSQLPDGYTASPEKGAGNTGFIMVKNEQDETVAMMTVSDDGKEYQVQNFKAGWKIESTSDLNDAMTKLVSATKIVNEGGQAVQLSDGTAGKMGSKVVHSKNGITGTIVGFQKDPNYVKVKPDSGGVIKIMSINQIKSNGSGGEPVSPTPAPNAPNAPSAETFIPQKSENMTMFSKSDGSLSKVIVVKNNNGTWDVVYDLNGPDFSQIHMDIEDRDEAESEALTALETNNFEPSTPEVKAEPAKPSGPKKFTFDFMTLPDVTDAPEIQPITDPTNPDKDSIKTDSAGTLIKPGAIVKDENGRVGVYRNPGYGDPNKMRMIWEDGSQDSVAPDTVTATGKYLTPGIAAAYAGVADLDFEKNSEPMLPVTGPALEDKNGKKIGFRNLVVDKNGDVGVVVENYSSDGYIKVAYPDGMKKRKANTLTALDTKYKKNIYNIQVAQKYFKNLDADKYNLPTFGATTKSGTSNKAPSGKLSVPKNGAGAKPQQIDQLGWDKSGFEGAPSLQELLTKVSTPGSGLAGGSIALDADAVEDLDLRIMAATGTDGKDAYLMKYKLTSWAGDELANKLLEMIQNNDPRVSATTGLSVPENLVDGDKVSFVPSLNGSSAKYKSGYGQTFIITLDDGTKIHFLRADVPTKHTSGSAKISSNGPRAYHNKVMIIAPKKDSTPESLALALNTGGVQDVRPSTKEDAKILIENRLMSILDEKVDPKSNPSGSERAASLQRIKDAWGITPENVTITTGAGGRIEMRLDPESAKKIANKTGIKVLRHTLRSSYSMQAAKQGETDEEARDRVAQYFVNRVSTPQGGLLSTTVRWSEGIPTSGQSSSRDIETGGADYVFTTPKSNTDSENSSLLPGLWFDAERTFQRLDFWANKGDQFGKRVGKSPIDQAVPGGYEVMFKGRLSFDDAAVLMVKDEDMRTRVITKLRQKGITQLGGRPLEAVVMTGPDYKAAKNTTK